MRSLVVFMVFVSCGSGFGEEWPGHDRTQAALIRSCLERGQWQTATERAPALVRCDVREVAYTYTHTRTCTCTHTNTDLKTIIKARLGMKRHF
eukprot:662854-Amphidinium_carterae.1